MRKASFQDLWGILCSYLHGETYLDRKIDLFFKNRQRDYVLVDSGTSAMQALIDDFNLQGSEIIIPSFICSEIFTRLCERNNITPVIVDCAPDSLNISRDEVSKRITSKTKAILIVHVLGLPCEPEKFRELCLKKKILLIEDCAHALHVPYGGKLLGDFGHASIFSFVKEIPSFTGGLYLNNSRKIKPDVIDSLKAYSFSTSDAKKLFHKNALSRTVRRKANMENREHSDLPQVVPSTLSKLGKAFFVYFVTKRDVAKSRSNAYQFHDLLKNNNLKPIISKRDIDSFSAKSFPVLVRNQKQVEQSLFNLGLNPGVGWTPTFSENKHAKKIWNLARTPNAERYSRHLIAISLDELTPKSMPLVIKALKKDSSI